MPSRISVRPAITLLAFSPVYASPRLPQIALVRWCCPQPLVLSLFGFLALSTDRLDGKQGKMAPPRPVHSIAYLVSRYHCCPPRSFHLPAAPFIYIHGSAFRRPIHPQQSLTPLLFRVPRLLPDKQPLATPSATLPYISGPRSSTAFYKFLISRTKALSLLHSLSTSTHAAGPWREGPRHQDLFTPVP